MSDDLLRRMQELDIPGKTRIDPPDDSDELCYMDSLEYRDLVSKECDEAFNLLVAMKGKKRAEAIVRGNDRIETVQSMTGVQFTCYYDSNILRSVKLHSLALLGCIPGYIEDLQKTIFSNATFFGKTTD